MCVEDASYPLVLLLLSSLNGKRRAGGSRPDVAVVTHSAPSKHSFVVEEDIPLIVE